MRKPFYFIIALFTLVVLAACSSIQPVAEETAEQVAVADTTMTMEENGAEHDGAAMAETDSAHEDEMAADVEAMDAAEIGTEEMRGRPGSKLS